eukprot:754314-Hanusia_phi.AAC.2
MTVSSSCAIVPLSPFLAGLQRAHCKARISCRDEVSHAVAASLQAQAQACRSAVQSEHEHNLAGVLAICLNVN